MTPSEDDHLIQDTKLPQSLCSDPSASQTFTLDNGDTIGYSTCGPASNDPIFLLHGWPGSRMHGLFFHSLAEELGAWIICPDRPGIGLSTPSPNRTLLDYPNIIAQLARHLGLNTYRILGWSGGGPFALACAKVLPREQLLRVGVLAGMGPADTGWDGLRTTNKILFRYTISFPWLMRLLLKWTIVQKAQDPDPEVLRIYMKGQVQWVRGQEKKDLEDLFAADPGAMEIKIESARESFRQGADGFIQEGQLLLGPWGFELESLETEVMLWYGTADINVPILVGREMAKKLKKAKLKEYEGVTHFTIFKHHAKEILRDLLQD